MDRPDLGEGELVVACPVQQCRLMISRSCEHELVLVAALSRPAAGLHSAHAPLPQMSNQTITQAGRERIQLQLQAQRRTRSRLAGRMEMGELRCQSIGQVDGRVGLASKKHPQLNPWIWLVKLHCIHSSLHRIRWITQQTGDPEQIARKQPAPLKG